MVFKRVFKMLYSLVVILLATFLQCNGFVFVKTIPLNLTLEMLEDVDATFGGELDVIGIKGYLVAAVPLNACNPIIGPPVLSNTSYNLPVFVLIERGNCSFDRKVMFAEQVGFDAVIVYNNENDDIFPMGRTSYGPVLHIPSVMVGRTNGIHLKNFMYPSKYFVVLNSTESPFNPESYMLPFLVVIIICFLLSGILMGLRMCRDWRHRRRNRLTKRHLKKIPEKKFKSSEDPYDTCAICLDDYVDNDKIRILPCDHAYHSKCIDPWLLKSKRSCPVCKRRIHLHGAPSRRSRPHATTSAEAGGIINPGATLDHHDVQISGSETDSETEMQQHAAGTSERTPLLRAASSVLPFRFLRGSRLLSGRSNGSSTGGTFDTPVAHGSPVDASPSGDLISAPTHTEQEQEAIASLPSHLNASGVSENSATDSHVINSVPVEVHIVCHTDADHTDPSDHLETDTAPAAADNVVA